MRRGQPRRLLWATTGGCVRDPGRHEADPPGDAAAARQPSRPETDSRAARGGAAAARPPRRRGRAPRVPRPAACASPLATKPHPIPPHTPPPGRGARGTRQVSPPTGASATATAAASAAAGGGCRNPRAQQRRALRASGARRCQVSPRCGRTPRPAHRPPRSTAATPQCRHRGVDLVITVNAEPGRNGSCFHRPKRQSACCETWLGAVPGRTVRATVRTTAACPRTTREWLRFQACVCWLHLPISERAARRN